VIELDALTARASAFAQLPKMKAFISWSGKLSHQVALELRRWIPTVVQAVDAWCSSEDIPKGAHWPSELARELDNASFGILCITRSNMTEPWINFEAGALSKALAGRRVSPFMFGLEPGELSGPLSQFQATRYEKEDVRRLVHSMNASCPSPVSEVQLNQTFDACWPRLLGRLDPLLPSALERGRDAGARETEGKGGRASPRKSRSTANLVLEDLNCRRSGTFITFEGRIRNNGDSPVDSVRVSVDWMTEDGTIMETDWAYATSDVLRPGAAKTWRIMSHDDPRISQYRYYLTEGEDDSPAGEPTTRQI
jgi:hypothetical protein